MSQRVTTQGPHTQQELLVANKPLDLLCIDFLKNNPSKDGKENVLVLTDAIIKFSQAFAVNYPEGTYGHKDISQQMVLHL